MALGNINIRETAIFILKKDSVDQYAEASGAVTTATSADDALELAFTPETAGDYLIIASCALNKNTTASGFFVRLNVDGTIYSSQNGRSNNTNNYYPWSTQVKVNLTAAAHSIKIQHWVQTSGAMDTRALRIVALRWDRLQNAYYAESRTRSTTTSTSYQDKVTLTQQAQSGNYRYVIFAGGAMDCGNVSDTVASCAIQDSTTLQEQKVLPTSVGSGGQDISFIALSSSLLSDVSRTWKTQFKSIGGNTIGFQDSAISILQTGGASVEIRGANILGANIL